MEKTFPQGESRSKDQYSTLKNCPFKIKGITHLKYKEGTFYSTQMVMCLWNFLPQKTVKTEYLSTIKAKAETLSNKGVSMNEETRLQSYHLECWNRLKEMGELFLLLISRFVSELL